MIKHCTACHKLKPLTDFYAGNAASGRMSWCKTCSHKYRREYNIKNPEGLKRRNDMRLRSIKGRADNLFRSAKRRALAKNLDFNLSIGRIVMALTLGVCERTGIRFDMSRPEQFRSRNPFVPSIDRINASLGYTNDNIQIVVAIYNLGKSQFTDDEFIAFCKIVAANAK